MSVTPETTAIIEATDFLFTRLTLPDSLFTALRCDSQPHWLAQTTFAPKVVSNRLSSDVRKAFGLSDKLLIKYRALLSLEPQMFYHAGRKRKALPHIRRHSRIVKPANAPKRAQPAWQCPCRH